MATDVNKNVSDIKEAQDKLVDSRGRLSRFSYTEDAYTTNEAYGVPSYNYAQEQNVPLATTEALETNATTVNKGFREQASSISRQLMNHFLGRTSFNLNKINDYFNSLIVQFLRHLSQDDNAYSATAVYVPDDICFVLDASHNKRTFRYIGAVADSGHAPLKDNGEIDTTYWNEINVSTVNGKTGKVTLTGADVNISESNSTKISTVLGTISGSPNSANGTVKLDSSGRIPYNQLPESAITLMGDWNASTNTPTLRNGVGILGEMYLVSVAGTWNGIEFTVNDRIIYNGSIWRKMEGGSVNSVNDVSPVDGDVTLTGADIKTSVTLQDKTTVTQTVQDAINNKQSTPVEITQANYNRLTATQRAKNIYIITDAPEIEDTYINDNVTTGDTTWSSNKITSNLNGALADYQRKWKEIGYGDSANTYYRVGFDYVQILTRHGEIVELSAVNELDAIRVSEGYSKILNVYHDSDNFYFTVGPWATSIAIKTGNPTTTFEQITSLPSGLTEIPIRQLATKNDLAEQQTIKAININSDEELWNYFVNIGQAKTGSININYASSYFANSYGSFIYTVGSDPNMINGYFSKLYDDEKYYVRINVFNREILTTQLATKNDLNPYLKVITVPVADRNSYSVPLESLPQGVYLVHLCYLYNSWQQVYLGMLMNYSTDNRDLIPICNNPSFPVAVTVNNSQIDCNSILSSAKFIQLGYW